MNANLSTWIYIFELFFLYDVTGLVWFAWFNYVLFIPQVIFSSNHLTILQYKMKQTVVVLTIKV